MCLACWGRVACGEVPPGRDVFDYSNKNPGLTPDFRIKLQKPSEHFLHASKAYLQRGKRRWIQGQTPFPRHNQKVKAGLLIGMNKTEVWDFRMGTGYQRGRVFLKTQVFSEKIGISRKKTIKKLAKLK